MTETSTPAPAAQMLVSHTRLNLFRQCPKAYEYQYIQCVPPAFSTIETHMGGAVHRTLEWLYGEYRDGAAPESDEVRGHYTDTWHNEDLAQARVVKVGCSVGDYFREGLEMTLAYVEHTFRHDRSTTLQLEYAFDVELAEGVRYRGVIDRMARMPDGVLGLIDYKTGRQVPHPAVDRQLRSYAWYVFLQLPQEKEIELCYEDLRRGRALRTRVLREDAGEVATELRCEVQKIRTTRHFIAVPSRLCAWCGYHPQCGAASTFTVRNPY